MKKKLTLITAVFVIAIISLVNISKNSLQFDGNISLDSFSLMSQTLAENNATNCPGGSCSYTDSVGGTCSACCPTGKNPNCDSWGCTCS